LENKGAFVVFNRETGGGGRRSGDFGAKENRAACGERGARRTGPGANAPAFKADDVPAAAINVNAGISGGGHFLPPGAGYGDGRRHANTPSGGQT